MSNKPQIHTRLHRSLLRPDNISEIKLWVTYKKQWQNKLEISSKKRIMYWWSHSEHNISAEIFRFCEIPELLANNQKEHIFWELVVSQLLQKLKWNQ